MKRSLLTASVMVLCACTPWLPAQLGVTKPVLQAAPAPQGSTSPAQVPAQSTPAATMSPAQVAKITSETPPDLSASSSTYIITEGDALEITVWKEPQFSSATIPVRPDGMISMPLLGDLNAAKVTPMHLSLDIGDKLKKYLNDPRVTVTVLSVKPKEVYLLGEIQHVGAIVLTPEMTPLQAIAAAGGLSTYAKSKNIYILRTVAGRKEKVTFNYKKAIKAGDLQGVTLLPGDTIVVP